MKTTPSLCAVAVISLSLVGCAPSAATTPIPAASTPVASASPPSPRPVSAAPLTDDQRDGLVPPEGYFDPYLNQDARVFDFAEVVPFFFRCDSCTIDSIVAELGAPDELFGQLDEGSNVWVELHYPKTAISVVAAQGWSFGSVQSSPDADGPVKHPITDADRATPVTVLSVETADPDAPLPRGLRIGGATREQVTAGYPAGSALFDEKGEYGNGVYYAYVWFNDLDAAYAAGGFWAGGMEYEFDDKDVLSSASVSWSVLGD